MNFVVYGKYDRHESTFIVEFSYEYDNNFIFVLSMVNKLIVYNSSTLENS